MDVNACCFLNQTSFLVELGGLLPLLHLFADRGYVDHNIVVIYVLSDGKSSLDVSHLDGSPSDTSVALSVVLFMIDIHVIVFLTLVQEGLLVQFLSFNCVSLVFNLRSKLSADELLFVWGNLLG